MPGVATDDETPDCDPVDLGELADGDDIPDESDGVDQAPVDPEGT